LEKPLVVQSVDERAEKLVETKAESDSSWAELMGQWSAEMWAAQWAASAEMWAGCWAERWVKKRVALSVVSRAERWVKKRVALSVVSKADEKAEMLVRLLVDRSAVS
jgi:hypothetical protein